MSPEWHFKQLRPGDKDRQPTQGEFFATDAIKSPAEALVRECIQNSLDAGLKEAGGPIRVRFSLGTGANALSPLQANPYFASGWKHFAALGNELDNVPTEDDACPFLVVEDFGTIGLNGDPQQYRHVPGEKNAFYYFFRTEGRSGKGQEDRGRWGIGKYVFPRSSRLNAFVAVTVRSQDQKRMLMGQAVLKSHTVGSQYFTPDADFGCRGSGKIKELVLPVEDGAFIDRFCEVFGLRRGNEPGLSVVIPWVVPETTREELLKAVVTNYFYPILKGTLVVTVAGGSVETLVASDTVAQVITSLGAEFAASLSPLVRLADWCLQCRPESVVMLNQPKSIRWETGIIPPELVPALRQRLRGGERLAIQVPVSVREGKGPKATERSSYFRMFLAQDGCESGVPTFIRDVLIISDARRFPAVAVRSLVVIEDPPLAKLLGDSENPAHTQWQRDREHFRHKYSQGAQCIEFVTRSVSSFVRLLNESDQDADKHLLKEIFSLPKPAENKEALRKATPRRRNQGDPIIPEVTVEPKKKRFRVNRIAGGFSVVNGASDAPKPYALEIRVAYDRRRGSPLNKYDPADFELGKRPIEVTTQGLDIMERDGNRLRVRVVDAEFAVTVTGFDENRDLFVDVQPREEPEETAQ